MMTDFFGKNSSDSAKEMYREIHVENSPRFCLGKYNTYHLLSDPRRLGFLFARYKFVAKMFDGFNKVLEVGCQEGLGTLVVAKAVESLTAIDFYRPHVETCREMTERFRLNIDFIGHDILDSSVEVGMFEGAFSLDVFEHISPLQENIFMQNIVDSLTEDGVFILGIPSLESQKYASEGSKKGHVNCKSGDELKRLCKNYYRNVFMFGMNDEVLHTGFLPMAHYLLAVCVGKK